MTPEDGKMLVHDVNSFAISPEEGVNTPLIFVAALG